MAGLTSSFGEELLRTHRNYQPLLAKVPAGMIKGLAHITGGGLIDNLPRVLPKNCDAVDRHQKLAVPPIFQSFRTTERSIATEMYQVFNMGIGMVAIVAAADAQKIARQLKAKPIGRIVRGRGVTSLSF